MSDRYKGAILSPTAPTVTPQSAGGIYTSSQQLQYQGQGVWPTAANNPLTNSLRFRSSASAYLSRTPASAGNRRTWTFSFWCKKGKLGTYQTPLWATTTGGTYDGTFVWLLDGDTFGLVDYHGSYGANIVSTAVYRDPSAWYHFICAVDTTQATASNRVKLYVNGVEITALSANTYPSQNYDFDINSNVAHNIGRDAPAIGARNYLDGYLAEVNFIDGVQLTPSSFGTTDAYGIWQPIPYTGAYGTNGFYLPFRPANSTFAGSFSGSSQWVSVPNLAAFSVGTSNYTVEGWFYFNTISSQGLFGSNNGSGSTPKFLGLINSSGAVLLEFTNSGGATFLTSSSGVVTAGQWYHIAWVRNSGTSTIYVNGVNVGSTSTSVNLAGLTQAWNIGYIGEAGPSSLNGLASNFRFVAGTAVYTANFTPPTAPLTSISGTQILTLQNSTLLDNSPNAATVTNTGGVTVTTANPFNFSVSLDYSGNGNNWTPNNISLVSGSTYDSMTDVPTNTNSNTANYWTLNPLNPGQLGTPQSGNLEWIAGDQNNFRTIAAPILPTSGKFYWEVQPIGGGSGGSFVSGIYIGIMNYANGGTGLFASGARLADTGKDDFVYYSDGRKVNLNSFVSYGTAYVANDIIGIAVDIDNGKIWFSKNGTWQASGDPAAGTNAAYTTVPFSTKPYAPAMSAAEITNAQKFNFGQRPFSYTPPSGFYPLNTYNLPTPTILDGDQYFNATTYTGNGSTQSITNSGSMQPDLVWMKSRSAAYYNTLYDVLRGTGTTPALYTNSTDSEGVYATLHNLTSFNSNGFSVGTTSSSPNTLNENGATFVAWQWRASNAAGVTNTNGSITTTVSANPTAGFSIVTYTGTGSNATIGHGLGVPPKVWFWKNRDASSDWSFNYYFVYNSMRYLFLNTTAAQGDNSSSYWGNPPTSTVNYIGGPDASTNINGQRFVMYAFAEVAGYSSISSYTGNGSTDGPFIYTGFRPRFILIKLISSGGEDWTINDTARNTYNVSDSILYPNSSSAEGVGSGAYIDFLSNGFKIRNNNPRNNANGSTYIYMAFAENPFKIARAR